LDNYTLKFEGMQKQPGSVLIDVRKLVTSVGGFLVLVTGTADFQQRQDIRIGAQHTLTLHGPNVELDLLDDLYSGKVSDSVISESRKASESAKDTPGLICSPATL
jgi:hypothetical protein